MICPAVAATKSCYRPDGKPRVQRILLLPRACRTGEGARTSLQRADILLLRDDDDADFSFQMLIGILLKVLSTMAFTAMSIGVRAAAPSCPIGEIVFFRS